MQADRSETETRQPVDRTGTVDTANNEANVRPPMPSKLDMSGERSKRNKPVSSDKAGEADDKTQDAGKQVSRDNSTTSIGRNGKMPRDDSIYLKPMNEKSPTGDLDHYVDMSNEERPKSAAEGGSDDEEEEDEEMGEVNWCNKKIEIIHNKLKAFGKRHYRLISLSIRIILLLLYAAYFLYAIVYDVKKATGLIVITVLIVLLVAWSYFWKSQGDRIKKTCCLTVAPACNKCWRYGKWLVWLILLAGVATFVGMDVAKDPRRLTSLAGLVILVLVAFIFSKHPHKVKWRPVIWGLGLQFFVGLVVLRIPHGYGAIRIFSSYVVTFLNFSRKGAHFVFGDAFEMHPFAFESMPVVIFFSSIISLLYYWGILQKVIQGMASLMQVTMGTTAIESIATASNIFVSYVETAPILMPYFHKLTSSEVHAILTAGFASVAGSILALYINFGAPPEHLISACLMSAPAGLAVAKLTFPETKKSRTRTGEDVKLPRGSEKNPLEAAANGAMNAIKLVAGISVCLIAFLSIIEFINASLQWFGSRVGVENLTFQRICSYVLWPLALIMGVEVEDAGEVASLLGAKLFVDEIICYQGLGEHVRNGTLHDRSVVIATYACCGFGSLGAVGVALGTMLAISRGKQRHKVTELMPRALIHGNIAAFMTACMAGLLWDGSGIQTASNSTTTPVPFTTLTTP